MVGFMLLNLLTYLNSTRKLGISLANGDKKGHCILYNYYTLLH